MTKKKEVLMLKGLEDDLNKLDKSTLIGLVMSNLIEKGMRSF